MERTVSGTAAGAQVCFGDGWWGSHDAGFWITAPIL